MKKFICILLFFIPVCVFARKSNAEISRMLDMLRSKHSISYTVKFTFKGADRRDTMVFADKVYLQKSDTDNVFGGKIWVAPNDDAQEYEFYDLMKIYKVDKYRYHITMTDPYAKPELKKLSYFNEGLLLNEYLFPAKVGFTVANSDFIIQQDDSVINKKKYTVVTIHTKTQNPFHSEARIIQYLIDKNTGLPYCKKEWVQISETAVQYKEWLMADYTFDNVTDSKFSYEQIPKNYRMKVR